MIKEESGRGVGICYLIMVAIIVVAAVACATVVLVVLVVVKVGGEEARGHGTFAFVVHGGVVKLFFGDFFGDV